MCPACLVWGTARTPGAGVERKEQGALRDENIEVVVGRAGFSLRALIRQHKMSLNPLSYITVGTK